VNPINIFGKGTLSRSENVTAQQRVNCYLEATDDKAAFVAFGTPGLTLFSNFSTTPVRGMYAIGSVLYVVHGSTFYTVTTGGVATSRGTLLTSAGRVSITDNGQQVFIVDGTYAYTYTIATTTFARVTDVDLTDSPVTAAFIDGFFVVNRGSTGQFFISKSYDGSVWDALDYATAESSPDNLKAVFVDHGQLVLMGENTTEFWANIGALYFPFGRVSGATQEWGVASIWSIAKFGTTIMWLARNRMGEVQVVMFEGYQPIRVSTPDIENIFNSYADVSDATGLSYLYNGHPFYQINFTTAGTSWLYDGQSDVWSQLKTGTGRHRSEMAVAFNNEIITSDYTNGKLYKVDATTYSDDGEAIIMELTTKHVFEGLERITIDELQMDIESGVGTPSGPGSSPIISMSMSKDSGHTYDSDTWVQMSMGAIGEYKTRAIWRRLGQGREWVFKFKISDPVKRVILGAWLKVRRTGT